MLKAAVIAALLAALLAVGEPVLADTPLTPPADFVNETDGAVIIGDVVANITTIRPSDGPAWVIPIWARYYTLSPDKPRFWSLPTPEICSRAMILTRLSRRFGTAMA